VALPVTASIVKFENNRNINETMKPQINTDERRFVGIKKILEKTQSNSRSRIPRFWSMTFSIYAITGTKKEESMPAPSVTEKIAGTYENTPLTAEEPTPQPDGKIPWLWMILAVLLTGALVYAWKRR
jgi:hypothetical protein